MKLYFLLTGCLLSCMPLLTTSLQTKKKSPVANIFSAETRKLWNDGNKKEAVKNVFLGSKETKELIRRGNITKGVLSYFGVKKVRPDLSKQSVPSIASLQDQSKKLKDVLNEPKAFPAEIPKARPSVVPYLPATRSLSPIPTPGQSNSNIPFIASIENKSKKLDVLNKPQAHVPQLVQTAVRPSVASSPIPEAPAGPLTALKTRIIVSDALKKKMSTIGTQTVGELQKTYRLAQERKEAAIAHHDYNEKRGHSVKTSEGKIQTREESIKRADADLLAIEAAIRSQGAHMDFINYVE
ncbi:hypothetical protein FJ365_04420 [Candidatus Dependentiae bacterium]|nr:hypothetical protein [Candidatus Dependentiae bacterium]